MASDNSGVIPKTRPEAELPVEDIFASTHPETAAPAERRPEQRVEVTPDAVPERRPEQQVEVTPESEVARRQAAVPPPAPPAAEPVAKSADVVQIENVLSEHLDELYLQMTPEQQLQFRQKGEETASRISVLLRETKIKVKEILNLIREWLKIIPGINKFFLEQEAKIKTERLLSMHEQKNK
ncbi:MAG: hypothetical protein V1916_02120 [Patescibacteria group bacterium]